MSAFRAVACPCVPALALPLPTYMTTGNLSVLATEIIQRDNAAKGLGMEGKRHTTALTIIPGKKCPLGNRGRKMEVGSRFMTTLGHIMTSRPA